MIERQRKGKQAPLPHFLSSIRNAVHSASAPTAPQGGTSEFRPLIEDTTSAATRPVFTAPVSSHSEHSLHPENNGSLPSQTSTPSNKALKYFMDRFEITGISSSGKNFKSKREKRSGIGIRRRDKSDASGKRGFQVNIPTKMLLYVAVIFFFVPLVIGFYFAINRFLGGGGGNDNFHPDTLRKSRLRGKHVHSIGRKKKKKNPQLITEDQDLIDDGIIVEELEDGGYESDHEHAYYGSDDDESIVSHNLEDDVSSTHGKSDKELAVDDESLTAEVVALIPPDPRDAEAARDFPSLDEYTDVDIENLVESGNETSVDNFSGYSEPDLLDEHREESIDKIADDLEEIAGDDKKNVVTKVERTSESKDEV